MIQIIKLATKTKNEVKYEYSQGEFDIKKLPSHYRIIYNCQECGREVNSSIGNQKRKNNFLCQSCSIKKEWEKEGYKTNHKEKLKEKCNTKEYKEKRRLIAEQLWKDEGYKKKHKEAIQKFCNTESYREKLRVAQRERWERIEYREKYFKMISSEEYKTKQREGCKKKWEDPEFIKKQQNRQWGYIVGLRYKDVYCRSFAEYVYLKYIDGKVKNYESCDFTIPYVNKNGERKLYIPDFKLTNFDNTITIIEVKGSFKKDFKNLDIKHQGGRFCSLDKETNKIKENILNLFCKEKGWKAENITFDNKEFYDLYKKERKKYHENKADYTG